MKKLSLKLTLLGLMFAGIFLFMGTDQAVAQGSGMVDELYVAPSGNFVSQQEAETRLKAEMTDIKAAMENQTPGTQAYRENSRKLAYYTSITEYLKSGSGVGDAIASGLGVFASAQYGQGVTRDKKEELKDLAVDVLTN